MKKLILCFVLFLIASNAHAETKVGCPGIQFYPFCSQPYSVHIENDDQQVFVLQQYMGWKKIEGSHSANVCIVGNSETDSYGDDNLPNLAIFRRQISHVDPVYYRHQFFTYLLSSTQEGKCWNEIKSFKETNSYQIN